MDNITNILSIIIVIIIIFIIIYYIIIKKSKSESNNSEKELPLDGTAIDSTTDSTIDTTDSTIDTAISSTNNTITIPSVVQTSSNQLIQAALNASNITPVSDDDQYSLDTSNNPLIIFRTQEDILDNITHFLKTFYPSIDIDQIYSTLEILNISDGVIKKLYEMFKLKMEDKGDIPPNPIGMFIQTMILPGFNFLKYSSDSIEYTLAMLGSCVLDQTMNLSNYKLFYNSDWKYSKLFIYIQFPQENTDIYTTYTLSEFNDLKNNMNSIDTTMMVIEYNTDILWIDMNKNYMLLSIDTQLRETISENFEILRELNHYYIIQNIVAVLSLIQIIKQVEMMSVAGPSDEQMEIYNNISDLIDSNINLINLMPYDLKLRIITQYQMDRSNQDDEDRMFPVIPQFVRV